MRYLSGLKSRRSRDKNVQQGDAVLTLKGPLITAAIAVISPPRPPRSAEEDPGATPLSSRVRPRRESF